MAETTQTHEPIRFETHPERYVHWRLEFPADDGSSAVSFPEAPLLAVLPGTGGLTRLVDKRKIRRDLADAFSTIAEGVRGKRSVEWGLVDESPPKAKFEDVVKRRLDAMIARSKRKAFPKLILSPLEAKRTEKG